LTEPLFIDLEATPSGGIKELGIVFESKRLHTHSIQEAVQFIQDIPTAYIAGHNLIAFDKKYLEKTTLNSYLKEQLLLDTLPVSLLLFSEKTFHNLPKNYKSEDCFVNNPVKDAELSRDLLHRSIDKFLDLPKSQQTILYLLLNEQQNFQGFFKFLQAETQFQLQLDKELFELIIDEFKPIIKNPQFLKQSIEAQPIELAYILAIRMPELEVNAQAPKILYDYPGITELQEKLCFDPQDALQHLDEFALENFGFANFRDFPRQDADLFNGPVLSQREIVAAAIRQESFIAILPTGGGKTFTFWLPALVKAKALKTLTVVISPLQALIKDHMESFEEQLANYSAVALSGYLSPNEHVDAIDRVVNGDADLLYLAPESLRSNRVFNLLKNRVIDRFVIDEAHCLSTWGNDFRHDYFYIGAFIKDLLAAKPFQSHIPVSCFTATAKPKVLDDISHYMEQSLGLTMQRYIAVPERHNLDYEGYEVKEEKGKYSRLLELVNDKAGSTLIYIPSSTRRCDEIAEQLALDTGKNVRSFHSRLDSDIKMQILKDYINDSIDIVVATTAFGMGVDKPNIENVIHYEVSESLENYAQEAGRGARNQDIRASCPLLFEPNDLDKHFTTINRSKLNADEINAVFRVLKEDQRNPVMMTSREIANQAGWDTEDSGAEYDMKVKTALLELEREEYLQRSRNKVNFYADAVARDAHDLLQQVFEKRHFDHETQTRLFRVLQSLLGRGKPDAVELDELSLILGYPYEQIAQAMVQLKHIGVIGDAKDLSLTTSTSRLSSYPSIQRIENKLFDFLKNHLSNNLKISELNQFLLDQPNLSQNNLSQTNQNHTPTIKLLLKSWRGRDGQFKFNRIDRARDLWHCKIIDQPRLQQAIRFKQQIAEQLVTFFGQLITSRVTNQEGDEKQLLEFSILELQQYLGIKSTKAVDKALLHLHELKVVELGQGRFIYYSPMTIQKLEKMSLPNKRYTKQEYQERLKPFYQRKMESVHIVGEYSSRLIRDSQQNSHSAQSFMRDYFTLSYDNFIRKYQALKDKFRFPMTEQRYQKIFQSLSDEQQKIIDDKSSQAIMILAGPGSGKTKVLVHKIASLILQEDIKPEQFLMLTYSRTAMLEFKSRLFQLLGQLAYEIDIFTFHGYALQLIGRQVESEKNNLLRDVVKQAAQQIQSNSIAMPYKTVLVLDEYQDINADGFALIKAIADSHQNNKRLIAVGDDDQCILKGVNGADVHFIKQFEEQFGIDEEGNRSYAQYELLTNYRSQNHLVTYTNDFVEKLSKRYKHQALTPYREHPAGQVKVISYLSSYLQQPAVQQAKQMLSDYSTGHTNIAILAYSNNEVADIYALLLEQGLKAKYLLNHEGFRLAQLIEIYSLNDLLEEQELNENSLWQAYDNVERRFKGSKNLPLVKEVIQEFIDGHEVFTPSLWLAYLDEISSEQLISQSKKILVSTIHKAKGKEFDCVILLVRHPCIDDELRRIFYVGMTRAKKQLLVLTNNPTFKQYAPEFVKQESDANNYPQPIHKTYVMGLADIHLSFSIGLSLKEIDLIAGSKLELKVIDKNKPYLLLHNKNTVARFSKSMFEHLKSQEQQGYQISDIKIENVVVWFDEKIQQYRQQPLCKIVMEKQL
jgi:ATP-dependent DNA helicase RecQ